MSQTKKIRFDEHLRELRIRLTYPVITFIVGSITAYFLYPQIINFIKQSLNQPLYFQTPAGGFTLVMKICILTGLFLALPVLTYNILVFVEPALPKSLGRKTINYLALLAFILAIFGGAFTMYILIPLSLKFFLSFRISGISSLLSANEYLNYVLSALITSMIFFQIPFVILLVDFIYYIKPNELLKYEKWVIIGSLAIAIILPFTYDPITQFVFALPIVALYNMSILFVWIKHQNGKRKTSILKSHSTEFH